MFIRFQLFPKIAISRSMNASKKKAMRTMATTLQVSAVDYQREVRATTLTAYLSWSRQDRL